METKFQTSFIPKKPSTSNIGIGSISSAPRKHIQSSIYMTIATLLFIASILGAGGVYAYNIYLINNLVTLKADLSQRKQQVVAAVAAAARANSVQLPKRMTTTTTTTVPTWCILCVAWLGTCACMPHHHPRHPPPPTRMMSALGLDPNIKGCSRVRTKRSTRPSPLWTSRVAMIGVFQASTRWRERINVTALEPGPGSHIHCR